MPVEIKVPSMGESVVEATIAQWLKNPGDTVKAGEDLVELETEKVNQAIQAEADGVLGEVLKKVGDTVGVGEVLGILSENGAAPAQTKEEPTQPVTAPPTSETKEIKTTPLAAEMAARNNIDLSTVTASRPDGRVGKDDLKDQIATATQPVPPTAAPAQKVITPPPVSTSTGRPEERIRMTTRRAAIARNLVAAQQNTAMLTTFNEVDMSAVMELRKRRKQSFEERFGVGLGFMSFFTKAVIGALKQFPDVNAEIQGNEIVRKKYYDIGIAVGAEEGLVVPVVRDADKMTFAEIEKKIKELALKAKDNKLAITELTGGTFTITNGGVYGSLMSTPIVNYPQVGILGMHTIKERAVVINGEIVARPMMYIALSYDHRVIDGSTAVRFLVKVKDLIEDPETLLLEG